MRTFLWKTGLVWPPYPDCFLSYRRFPANAIKCQAWKWMSVVQLSRLRSAPTLGVQTGLAGLVLGDLVHCVLLAVLVLAESALGLGNVHLHSKCPSLRSCSCWTSRPSEEPRQRPPTIFAAYWSPLPLGCSTSSTSPLSFVAPANSRLVPSVLAAGKEAKDHVPARQYALIPEGSSEKNSCFVPALPLAPDT